MDDDHAPAEFGTGLRQIGMVVDLLRLSAREAVEDIAPLLHPNMRVLAAPGIAPARRYETREDFLEYFAEAHRNRILIEPDAHEIRIGASGAIVVAGSVRMTNRGSVADKTPVWFVYTFRDGLIASLATHLDPAMAEEAAESQQG